MLQLPLTRRHPPSSSRGQLAPSRARPPSLARRGKLVLEYFTLSSAKTVVYASHCSLLLLMMPLLSNQIRGWYPWHGGSWHRHHSGLPMGSLRWHGAQRPGEIWNCLESLHPLDYCNPPALIFHKPTVLQPCPLQGWTQELWRTLHDTIFHKAPFWCTRGCWDTIDLHLDSITILKMWSCFREFCHIIWSNDYRNNSSIQVFFSSKNAWQ